MRDWKEISAEEYNWRITKAPERPYIHDYTKAITYKIYMAEPNVEHTASKVIFNYEDALKIIKEMDAISLGAPKIAYLVGWQYLGHDSKYPAWHEMNEALKRPQDKCAHDSYMWLFEEAKKYNTTLSVHINMFDAYENSPLWQTYVDNGLIATLEDGTLVKVGIWNGQQAYPISYPMEWKTGYAKKRIDEICELLPLREAGTVHIDALHCKEDLGHGYNIDDARGARRQIIRYWRDLGVDVTSEFLYYDTPSWAPRKESTVGLLPLCYHFSQNLEDYISRPASLVCGGNATYRFKEGLTERFDVLFGCQGDYEPMFNRTNRKEVVFNAFCNTNLRFFYLNTLDRLSVSITDEAITAYFSNNVTTELYSHTMTKNGAIMQKGHDMLIPTEWYEKGTAVAYSANGGEFEYDIAKILETDAQSVEIRKYSECGLDDEATILKVIDGKISFKLDKASAILIKIL